MSERATLVGAGAAHLALIAALSLAWANMDKPALPPPDAIAVDLVNIADTPKATAAPREATAPEPPPPTRKPDVAPPPPPEPLPKAEPPKAAPPKAVAPDPVPEPVTEESTPKPKPHKVKPPKPTPTTEDVSRSLDELLAKSPARPKQRPRADPSQLASLLDKELGRAPPRVAKPGPAQTAQPVAVISPLAMATLAQAIRAQIEKCWNPPTGLPEATTVTLRIKLTDSGAAAGTPEITGRSGAVDPATRRVFDESARRAVLRCSPLRLPKELYAQWRDIELNFDPKDVL